MSKFLSFSPLRWEKEIYNDHIYDNYKQILQNTRNIKSRVENEYMKIIVDHKNSKKVDDGDNFPLDEKITKLKAKIPQYNMELTKMNSYAQHLINKSKYQVKILNRMEDKRHGRKYDKKMYSNYLADYLDKLNDNFDAYVKTKVWPEEYGYNKFHEFIKMNWNEINEMVVNLELEPLYSMLPEEIRNKKEDTHVTWVYPEGVSDKDELSKDMTDIFNKEKYDDGRIKNQDLKPNVNPIKLFSEYYKNLGKPPEEESQEAEEAEKLLKDIKDNVDPEDDLNDSEDLLEEDDLEELPGEDDIEKTAEKLSKFHKNDSETQPLDEEEVRQALIDLGMESKETKIKSKKLPRRRRSNSKKH